MAEIRIIERCTAELLSRRNAAISGAGAKTALLYEKIPSLRSLDASVSSTASRMLEAAMGSNFEAEKQKIRKETELLQEKRRVLLISNGFEADFDSPDFRCKRCRDTGYIGYNMCDCLKSMISVERYNASGIGGALSDCSFDNFNTSLYSGELADNQHPRDVMEKIKSFCRNYAESFRPPMENLIFIGSTGLGKTHLSAAIGKTVASLGYTVLYESAQQLQDTCREAAFGSDDIDTGKYTSCDLLLIDDFGAESKNDFGSAVFTELINRRIIMKKATVISTNLTAKDINARYSPRLASRIFGEFAVKNFAGRDIRMIKVMLGRNGSDK